MLLVLVLSFAQLGYLVSDCYDDFEFLNRFDFLVLFYFFINTLLKYAILPFMNASTAIQYKDNNKIYL